MAKVSRRMKWIGFVLWSAVLIMLAVALMSCAKGGSPNRSVESVAVGPNDPIIERVIIPPIYHVSGSWFEYFDISMSVVSKSLTTDINMVITLTGTASAAYPTIEINRRVTFDYVYVDDLTKESERRSQILSVKDLGNGWKRYKIRSRHFLPPKSGGTIYRVKVRNATDRWSPVCTQVVNTATPLRCPIPKGAEVALQR